jgi:hypothetical protein
MSTITTGETPARPKLKRIAPDGSQSIFDLERYRTAGAR